nr:glycoside hydrolase family 2 TIM barrel-domain containing protein [uncultured Sphaerochaeta sp.]
MQERYSVDEHTVLEKYPRPQLVRGSYQNLNGWWDFAISNEETRPPYFPLSILVPFSPETKLSGLQTEITPNLRLWYHRTLTYTVLSPDSRLLLHFEAVDYSCVVFLNGIEVGSHQGGYLPFSFDITDLLKKENDLLVKVVDPGDSEPIIRGKQASKASGIFYQGQSGIHQTVWIEEVPQFYIKNLIITPDLAQHCWYVQVIPNDGIHEVTISYLDGHKQCKGMSNQRLCCQVEKVHPWSPEDPYLYPLTIQMGIDIVTSYVGLRSFEVQDGRLLLNGKPYYQHGILDQGYWPHSLYTAPSDQAIIDDLVMVKKLGFNMVRKHAKVESRRWYHHCDVLGLLVWQDMVSGGRPPVQPIMSAPLFVPGFKVKDHHYRLLGSQDAKYREMFATELTQMIETLYNCVSIAMWVIFNEGWGQFDAKEMYSLVKALDSTRTIDCTSGWYDQGIGEFSSRHVYFKRYRHQPDKLSRAIILSEFGGYLYRVEGHDDEGEKPFGYKHLHDRTAFNDAFFRLYEEEVYPAKQKGLAASVYTQLTDVQQELNGLVTFDRMVVKLDEVVALQVAALLLGTEERE